MYLKKVFLLPFFFPLEKIICMHYLPKKKVVRIFERKKKKQSGNAFNCY